VIKNVIMHGAANRSKGDGLTKSGSDIPYFFWDRARVTDPLKPAPDSPGVVVRLKQARRPDAANVLKNVATCRSFWQRIGIDKAELELEAMDLSRPCGDLGAAIRRERGPEAMDGYCLGIWGLQGTGRSQIGRLRIYDVEEPQHGIIRHYGVIGDLNVPNILVSDLLQPMLSLAVFVCEVFDFIPVLAVAARQKNMPIINSEAPLVRDHQLFARLSERIVVAAVDESSLRVYRGMAQTIYLGGGITPDDPSGMFQLPIRLGKNLRKLLCIHLKRK
jgi:hypothetical protein